jgi:hypothetical protein
MGPEVALMASKNTKEKMGKAKAHKTETVVKKPKGKVEESGAPKSEASSNRTKAKPSDGKQSSLRDSASQVPPPVNRDRPERAPDPKAMSYSDGHPLDNVHYLECKIILKPDRFTSAQSFREFGEAFRRMADRWKIGYTTTQLRGQGPQIREVIFLDTADFRLYNNAHILRRRITYQEGFPVGDPEIVFKFRHPDRRRAAELDVRPNIPGIYHIKFKAEILPLRDRVGGFRKLFSHNAQFGFSQMEPGDRASMATLAKVFPCLAPLRKSKSDRVDLVNHTIVEEILFDLGRLDFGKGVLAKADVGIWRRRGDHKPLVAELAFQAKFDRANELHQKAMERCENLFVGVQNLLGDEVYLGATKTGIVYRLNGNPPQNHE